MLFDEEPTTWVDPPPTTLLHQLLVFVGIPLLIVVVITLLVMAPSLAKSTRYSPGQRWDGEPEWFGTREPGALRTGTADSGHEQRQLSGSTQAAAPDDDTGGASVRW